MPQQQESDALVGQETIPETEDIKGAQQILNFVEPVVIFKVQNALFGIPRAQVLKSGFFRNMMLDSPHIGTSEEGSMEHPIVFDERTRITKSDMKSLCTVLDVRVCDPTPVLSAAEWASAYRLADMWQFDQHKEYCLTHLDPAVTDPFERIEYSDALGLQSWLVPAMAQLCFRENPLTAAEGSRLGLERFAFISRHREQGRQQLNVAQYEAALNSSMT